MVTISCTCGAVAFPTGDPLRDLTLGERLDVVAHRVTSGTVTVALDPQWHPGGPSLAVDCAVLVAEADLDALVAHLTPADAAAVHAAWFLPRDDSPAHAEVAATGAARTA